MIWAETADGKLNVSDPARVQFEHHALESDEVLSRPASTQVIQEDGDDILWVRQFYGGLFRFDRAQNRFVGYRHNPSDPSSLPSNLVREFRDVWPLSSRKQTSVWRFFNGKDSR